MDASLKEASRERLIHDLDNVVSDIQVLVSKTSAGGAGETHDRMLGKLGAALDDAKSRVELARHRIADNARAATEATDAYLHGNAWKMIALAAASGLIAGLIAARR